MTYEYRVPQIDLAAVLAQSNPTIDLRINVYENSTKNFLKALGNYKNRSISTISDRRKHQAGEKKKIEDRAQMVDSDIGQCKMREIELVAQLEREKEERKDAELHAAGFKRQHAALREKFTSIEADIEHYQSISQDLRREKSKEQSILGINASHLLPQLSFCEEYLSCRIEGLDNNRLLVSFFRLDPTNPEQEASFVLNLSPQSFKVMISTPHLPAMTVLVNQLNEDQDIYAFLKQVRAEYQLVMQSTHPGSS